MDLVYGHNPECHFLKPTTIWHNGLWLGDACPAIAFGLLDRIIMCHIGQKLEYLKNRHIQEFVDSLLAIS